MKYTHLTKIILVSIVTPTFLLATPNNPSNLILKALSSTSVSIKWGDNSDNETGYKVFRNGKLIKFVGSDTTDFIDDGLSPNTTYEYTIKSTDDSISEPSSGVHISEIAPSNYDSGYDHDYYKFSDYIELKNYSSSSKNIGGYIISDDKKSWTIPSNTTIEAGKTLIIWADKKDTKKKELHANFKLSSKKEKVTLKDSSGNIIDEVSFKKVPDDISLRKGTDGKLVYMMPSLNHKNTSYYLNNTKSDKPSFSIESGSYDGSQTIILSNENGGNIYYTSDGSTPTNSSSKYTSPITISKSTVIKAITIESGKIKSKVTTNSYILGFDSTLPILSLSTDNRYLFDDYIGIYVKGKNGAKSTCMDDGELYNFEQDWYRPVRIEYFNNNQKEFSKKAEFAISGQCSRWWNKKKSFRFELDDKLEHKIYNTKGIEDIEDFKLRAGHRSFEIGNLMANQVVAEGNLDVDYQDYVAVNMLMNGEFWGVYNFTEKKGTDFITSNYPDVDKDKIDIIKVSQLKKGNLDAYNKLSSFINNSDLSSSTNYNKAKEMIDEDNFIDYLCVMLYSTNDDWIGSNYRMWRERVDGAKWRFMIDDVDRGFQISNVNKNMFDYISTYRADTLLKKMFNAFNRNSTFKSKFKNRFNELLDTTLATSNMSNLADKLIDERREYDTKGKFAISNDSFNSYADNLKEFVRKRRDVVRSNLNNF
jgi:hypothetical protein